MLHRITGDFLNNSKQYKLNFTAKSFNLSHLQKFNVKGTELS